MFQTLILQCLEIVIELCETNLELRSLKRSKHEPAPSFYLGGRPAPHCRHAGGPGEHCKHRCVEVEVSLVQGILLFFFQYLTLLFRKVDLSNTFCQLLTMLAVFDSILVVSAVISFSLPLISQYWNLVILYIGLFLSWPAQSTSERMLFLLYGEKIF